MMNKRLFFTTCAAMMLVVSVSALAASGSVTASETRSAAGVSPDAMVCSQPESPLAVTASKSVLIVQSVCPWGSTADADVLTSIGYSYTVVDPSGFDAMSAAAVQAYNIVLIPGDQPGSFYGWYAQNVARFTQYATNGGYLVFFAAYQSGEPLDAPLPGGVTSFWCGQSYNVIDDATDPVVTDALSEKVPLTNADLYGDWCSHVVFNEGSLPAGAKVIFRAANGCDVATRVLDAGPDAVAPGYDPVTVRYPLGSGSVFASGNTWEIAYDYGWAYSPKALDDVFLSGGGSAYDLSYMDDFGRAKVCVNSKTGDWQYKVLSGAGKGTYMGKGSVSKTADRWIFRSVAGSPRLMLLTVWPQLFKATASLGGSDFTSWVSDRNIKDDPPGC